MLAYALAALGTLTKGVQAPIYFGLSVGTFLLVSGEWRRLLTRAHLLGVLAFVAIFGAWAVPCMLRLGPEWVLLSVSKNAAQCFNVHDGAPLTRHLVTFPLEVLGCMLPWSLCLLAYLRRPFRQAIGAAAPHVRYLFLCMGVTFPSVWLAQWAESRYWMPLYPCGAVLVGLVVQRTVESAVGSPLRTWWTQFVTGCALLLAAVAVLALAGGLFHEHTSWPLQQPAAPLALGFALTLAALLTLLWQQRHRFESVRAGLAVFTIAWAVAVSYSGWYINILNNRNLDTHAAVAHVKDQLAGQPLVSLDYTHHLFLLHYEEPVPRLDWPASEQDLPDDVTYFCICSELRDEADIPFAWEKVAVVNCDRAARPDPHLRVTIGRRLKPAARK
jgi:4-amino-4-deoxy-L-arabinose transferase-like glycosyltransferase